MKNKILLFSILLSTILATACNSNSVDVKTKLSQAEPTKIPSTQIQEQEVTESDTTITNSDVDTENVDTTVTDDKLAGLKNDVIVLTDDNFVALANELYYNAEMYMGKNIKYEGAFFENYQPDGDVTYYTVTRIGPGCCSSDSVCGFEVMWEDSTKNADFPENDSWVEVEGVYSVYTDSSGGNYFVIKLNKLEKMDVRGNDTVTN